MIVRAQLVLYASLICGDAVVRLLHQHAHEEGIHTTTIVSACVWAFLAVMHLVQLGSYRQKRKEK